MTPPAGGRSARRLGAAVRVARGTGVLCRELDGETILLDPESGTYYALNEVGSRVWELAAERPSVEEILRRLGEEYAVDESTLGRDVDALLGRLLDEGLIEVSEERSRG